MRQPRAGSVARVNARETPCFSGDQRAGVIE